MIGIKCLIQFFVTLLVIAGIAMARNPTTFYDLVEFDDRKIIEPAIEKVTFGKLKPDSKFPGTDATVDQVANVDDGPELAIGKAIGIQPDTVIFPGK